MGALKCSTLNSSFQKSVGLYHYNLKIFFYSSVESIEFKSIPNWRQKFSFEKFLAEMKFETEIIAICCSIGESLKNNTSSHCTMHS
jgi:hypothetical protein